MSKRNWIEKCIESDRQQGKCNTVIAVVIAMKWWNIMCACVCERIDCWLALYNICRTHRLDVTSLFATILRSVAASQREV